MRKTFSYKTGQPMSTTCGRGKKERLFTEKLPLANFRYRVYFLLELKKVDVRLKKKKMKFYKETMKKNSNKIVQNQEQVAVSNIASVGKPSTSSCSSGKSRISNKNSSRI